MNMSNSSLNINYIVDNGMCNGCCECISSCSENNIYMMFNSEAGHPAPFVVAGCTGCGECLMNCPQYEEAIAPVAKLAMC